MIIEVFESIDSNEAFIEIKVENVEASRVLPFNNNVGERISKEKLKSLLNGVKPLENLNMDEPDSYFAQKVAVWLDDDSVLGSLTPFDIPHHIGLYVVLENILQKLDKSDGVEIRIS